MGSLRKVIDEFFAGATVPILFAGAGVSAKAGLPLWSDYLHALAAAANEYDQFTKYQIDDAVKDGALEDAASYFLMCRKIPEATKFQELVAPLLSYSADELVPLARLPFKAFVTTNFDRALFDAYASARGCAPREVNIDDPTLSGASFERDFYIARVHGRIEVPKSMRLSTESLAGLLENQSYVQFLTHLFTRTQVLFIGFSFLDPAIKAVLRASRATYQSSHRQEHLALVPDDAAGDFLRELEAHSIRRVVYDSKSKHLALWSEIESGGDGVAPVKNTGAEKFELPFAVAKKYLATAYARVRLGGQSGPLARAVAEGIVSGMIAQSLSAGLTEDELGARVMNELVVTEDVAKKLASQSIASLVGEGIISKRVTGQVITYVSNGSQSNSYDQAIDRLVDGTIARYEVREKGKDSAAIRGFLKEFFVGLVLRRGWDLCAAFAARKVPDDVDVMEIMNSVRAERGVATEGVRIGLVRSVEDLLFRPDDTEAQLLTELGRLGFGLELLIESPHDALFFQKTLPERIYLDANVLMPAITPGHPHRELFDSTVKALQETAERAVFKVSICVYFGFLNEIISHRQLAIDSMKEGGGEGAMWAEREAAILGTANVNVFIGAYFNIRESRPDISFEQFLTEYVPYNSEASLKKYLETRGFEIVRDGQVAKKQSGDILHALERFYATKLEHRKKSAIVISHDAAQLAIINADIAEQRRSILVSADRALRFALEESGFSSISNSIISHLGLAQLVELLIGRLNSPRGMASLLWMSSVSNDTERVRNHLITLALKEHDAALAMRMTDVVDAISEDAGVELASRGLGVDRDGRADRAEFNRVIERYETDFFRKMRSEISKNRG